MFINFTLFQGSTFEKEITWKDSAGTIIPISGYSARMQIRKSYDSVSFLSELTVLNGKVTVDSLNNKFILSIPDSETSTFTPGVYVYDFETISPTGKVKKLLKGKITIYPEATK